ncbi:hypothetical protein [Mycobacterium aquaticum]|uniref:Uncharacterized protein n=1 Tax=Mycobacterium aquaticum TaxID=1927124 RepID=A0A1X0A4J1_9MYCO|nr:hypothetical protein [Mycobacterium aquaticum]ORA24934.1 hypothetical protein BST13_33745 [Mycobacterium aquaticum]
MTKQQADFYVSFGGNHGQSGVDEPALGQQVEYTVFGTVSRVAEAIRDDGETRTTVSVDVEAAWPKGTKRPDAANQPAMVDHNGNVTPEAAGQEPESGGELIDSGDGDESNVVPFSDAGK